MKYLKKFNESESINTLAKFLEITGYKRHTNHPSVTKLKEKMDELNINDDLKIDIMSFFLYDHKSK